MSKQMPEALVTASQGSELIVRMLVTIFAPDQSPFRFVANDTDNLTMPNGNIYYAADIKRGDIVTNTEGDKEQIPLTLSNRNQMWAAYIANHGANIKGCRCLIEDVFLNHLDQGTVWRFQGIIDKLHVTISEFNCSIIRDAVNYDEDAPHMDYGPACQFVFKDSRCRYSGPLGPCDQTIASCDERGNVTRFQGHPSVPLETVIRQ